MRIRALSVVILSLLASGALAQTYEVTIHLRTGETVTVPQDEIRRIVFTNILTGVGDQPDAPRPFSLLPNYPNPFNPSTTVAYAIPQTADVCVRIFDLHGALVKELVHETQPAGTHEVTWDGTDVDQARVASGAYLCAVSYGEQTLTQRLMLVK